MAIINFTYRSQMIHKCMEVSVILPVEASFPGNAVWDGEKKFKTIYLLHGLTGSNREWLYNSDIAQYAEKKGIAVVIPNSWNRYYIDNPRTGELHGDYIAKEIVDLTRKMFPLSQEREDTCIGGFSMGGYGAFRLGLKYSDLFGSIISLAGGFRYRHMDQFREGQVFAESPSFFEEVYGDLNQIAGSEIDLEAAVQRIKEENKKFPRIYLAVGTEDSLYNDETYFRDYLRANDVEMTYEDGPGNHNWKFANYYLGRGLDWWMPEYPIAE